MPREPETTGITVLIVTFAAGLGIGIFVGHAVVGKPTIADLSAQFSDLFDQAKAENGYRAVCLTQSGATGPVRSPMQCPKGSWAWVGTGGSF